MPLPSARTGVSGSATPYVSRMTAATSSRLSLAAQMLASVSSSRAPIVSRFDTELVTSAKAERSLRIWLATQFPSVRIVEDRRDHLDADFLIAQGIAGADDLARTLRPARQQRQRNPVPVRRRKRD